MSCRTSPSGTGVCALCKDGSELNDTQVQSLIHKLKRDGAGAAPPVESEWHAFIAEKISDTMRSGLSPARMQSTAERLARGAADVPDGPLWFAYQNAERVAREQTDALNRVFQEHAERRGCTADEVKAEFKEQWANVPRGRSMSLPEGYEDVESRWVGAGTPGDIATIVALEAVESQTNELTSREPAPPRRVEMVEINHSTAVHSAGYDPEDGRFEIRMQDRHGEPGPVYAYHSVPEELWDNILNPELSAGQQYMRNIRGNWRYKYASTEEENAAAHRRCDMCGQWRGGSHSCPTVLDPNPAPAPMAEAAAAAGDISVALTPDVPADTVDTLDAEAAPTSPEARKFLGVDGENPMHPGKPLAPAVGVADPRQGDERPLRVTMQRVKSSNIHSIGYDPDGGHLEVVFLDRDKVTPRPEVYLYRNVPVRVGEKLLDPHEPVGVIYNGLVKGQSDYKYPSTEAANEARHARCRACGQWRGNGHVCPTPEGSGDAKPLYVPSADESFAPVAKDDKVRALANQTLVPAVEGSTDRCRTCGQFTNVEHACPTREQRPYNLFTYWNSRAQAKVDRIRGQGEVYGGWYRGESLRGIREGALDGPVSIDTWMSVHVGIVGYTVRGTIMYDRPERGAHVIYPGTLECRCSDPDCTHADLVLEAARINLIPNYKPPVTAGEAQAKAEAALAEDWSRNAVISERVRSEFAVDDPAQAYSDNPELFMADYAEVVARAKKGEPLPRIPAGAMGPSFTRENGMGFGVELEAVFPAKWSSREKRMAANAIAAEMKELELTQYGHQMSYGAAETTTSPDGWAVETDATVDVEVISPILFDDEGSWDALHDVLEVMKKHGATTSVKAGAHVHVSAPHLTPSQGSAIIDVATRHEDVLYRMAADPKRGRHRGALYCLPNRSIPAGGYQTVEEMQNLRRVNMVNVRDAKGESNDHVEMRMWDGSLDFGTIQSQIILSAALTKYGMAADREVVVPIQAREPLGSRHTRAQGKKVAGQRVRRKPTPEEVLDDTSTLRPMLDTLFRDPELKKHMIGLWYGKKWAPPRES